MNKFINKSHILMLLGFLLIFSFIWFRFIRERLPRDIPFNLNLWSLILIILTCITYIYIIYRTVNPKNKSYFKDLMQPWISKIMVPLTTLNREIIFNLYGQGIILFLLKNLNTLLFICLHIQRNTSDIVYIFIFILPKVLMLLCLFIDCFFSKKLSLIYTCAVVITLPMITQYLLYCSKLLQEKDVPMLEKHFIIEILSEDLIYTASDYDEYGMLKYDYHRTTYYENPSEILYDNANDINVKYLIISNFIYYKTNTVFFHCLYYKYNLLFQAERKDIDNVTLVAESAIDKNTCDSLLWIYIYNNTLYKYITVMRKYGATTINRINIIIYVLFFICWIYILMLSVYNLNKDIFYSVRLCYENPFSYEFYKIL